MTARQVLSSVAVAAIVMFVLPVFFDVLNLTTFAAYALLALSLGFVWGYGGILCFGQTAFYGLGAYVYALTAINTGEAWSGFFLAILLPALFAAILGAMMFYGRLSDVYLAVVTLVVSLILFRFMNHTAGEQWVIGEARLGGFNGIPGFPTLHIPGDPEAYIYDENLYYFTFVVLVLCYLLTRWLLGSSFGRILVGLRENEQRIELLGYDVRARKTAAFAFGGALAGLAGCLYANAAEIITPELFGLGLAAEIIIWVIVGGAGTLIGPMIGAAVLGYLKFVLGLRAVKEVFGRENPLEATLVFGVILILFILFLPRGVVPSIQGWLGKARPGRAGAAGAGRRRRTRAERARADA